MVGINNYIIIGGRGSLPFYDYNLENKKSIYISSPYENKDEFIVYIHKFHNGLVLASTYYEKII